MVALYEKVVEASWYEPRLKHTIDVSAITYEPNQKPSREKELTIEILNAYSGAGDFEYDDEMVVIENQEQPVYPEIEISTWFFKKIES